MNKKLLAAAAVSAMCLLPFSANAEEITMETLQEKAAAFGEDISSLCLDCKLNLDGALVIGSVDGSAGETSLSAAGSAEFSSDILLEPELKLGLNGNIALNAMGMISENIGIDAYVVMPEDLSSASVYAKMTTPEEAAEWTHIEQSLADVWTELGVSSVDDLVAMADAYTGILTPIENVFDWTVSEDGDLYVAAASVSFTDLFPAILEAAGSIDPELTADFSEDDLSMVSVILDPFILYVEVCYDKATGAMTEIYADLNDSDLSFINSLVGDLLKSSLLGDEEGTENTTVSIALNDLSFLINYDYNTISDVVIPEEALNAPITEADDSFDDLDELDDIVDIAG